MELGNFVNSISTRGECTCGKCFDAKEGPEEAPTDHTEDIMFFRVTMNNPDDLEENKKKFVELAEKDLPAAFMEGGAETDYLTLGEKMGDQGIALQTMAVGSLLNIWTLLTPRTMFGDLLPEEKLMDMAGRGLIGVTTNDSA